MKLPSIFRLLSVAPLAVMLLAGASHALMTGVISDIGCRNSPSGTLEILNHPCRVSGWQGPYGEMYRLSYRGEKNDLNEFLKKYSEIDYPTLELVFVDAERTNEQNQGPLTWELGFNSWTKNLELGFTLTTVSYCVHISNVEDLTVPDSLKVVDMRRQSLGEEIQERLRNYSSLGWDISPSYRHGQFQFVARRGDTKLSFAGYGMTELDALEDLAKKIRSKDNRSTSKEERE